MSMGFQTYEESEGLLFRLDPRVKLIGLISAFIISIIFSDPYFLGTMFILIFSLILFSRIPIKKIRLILGTMVLLSVMSIVMWPLFIDTGNKLFTVFGKPITDMGIKFGFAMGFRILCMVISSVSLIITTSQRDIILGLRGLRVPYKVSFVLATALRFLPTMTGVGKTINEAQRARALDFDSGFVSKMKNNAAILTPMIVESIRLSNQLVYSIEARGFSRKNKKTTMVELIFNNRDKIGLSMVIVIFLLSIILRVLGYGNISI